MIYAPGFAAFVTLAGNPGTGGIGSPTAGATNA
jgi:hypothetical protein